MARIHLRFTDVLEDSRCPTRVSCFWTGQARVSIVVEPAGHAQTTVEFNTNPAPQLNVSTERVGEYAIELQALDPYPQTPADSPSLQDYRATLMVTRV